MVKNNSRTSEEDDLVIYFMPFSEIEGESSIGKIKKLLGLVLQNKVIILQGKLSPVEESRLIENTMALIGNIRDFKGIEIASISKYNEYQNLFDKIRHNIAKILIGDHDIMTIIGPANIVKAIKRNPKKIELLLKRS
ncbi:MAG: OapB/ArvB family protein [Nanoarchaeota archaeon]